MKYCLYCLSVCLVLVSGVYAGEVVTEENITIGVSSGDPVEIFTVNIP